MWIWFLLAGIAGGVLGGMGMGGGTLLIPLLTLALGVEQMSAQAINLIAFVPMALVSLIFHIKNKLVDFKILLFTLPLATALSIAGALLVTKLGDDVLRKLFGWFMLIIGVVFLIKIGYEKMQNMLSSHVMEEKK